MFKKIISESEGVVLIGKTMTIIININNIIWVVRYNVYNIPVSELWSNESKGSDERLLLIDTEISPTINCDTKIANQLRCTIFIRKLSVLKFSLKSSSSTVNIYKRINVNNR